MLVYNKYKQAFEQTKIGGKNMERENSEKMKALEAALGQIEKQFGKGSVMKL